MRFLCVAGGQIMPAKGTKKVKTHIRRRYLLKDSFTGLKIEDPFAPRTKVKYAFNLN